MAFNPTRSKQMYPKIILQNLISNVKILLRGKMLFEGIVCLEKILDYRFISFSCAIWLIWNNEKRHQ